ncbi:MAG: enoyl-CoA hydratase/isomerase family protein [Gammaproteobacteria bacterium]|nr:enoyl-CoA hydratase/isomerase family protein [Gammaproteobacteria bacterium]
MDDNQPIIKTETLSPGILHIIFNRVPQLNALNAQVLQKLDQLIDAAKTDVSIKGILLSGQGKAFCAGADITGLASLNGAQGLAFAQLGQTVFRKLETLGKPSLAAIHGYALGGGCELAMSTTLRIATLNAVFGQPEIKLGVIPGFGGTQRLARLVGMGRALDLCLSGRKFSAEEAFQWGLVTELTDAENLLSRAHAKLKDIIVNGAIAIQAILATVYQGTAMPLDEGLALEAAYFGLCCSTKDKAEGVNAFLEKRQPQFSGE